MSRLQLHLALVYNLERSSLTNVAFFPPVYFVNPAEGFITWEGKRARRDWVGSLDVWSVFAHGWMGRRRILEEIRWFLGCCTADSQAYDDQNQLNNN